LIAIADRFDDQVLEALFLEDIAEDVKHLALERITLDGDLFEQPVPYGPFACFLGDEAPKMAHLRLADAVNAAEPLFEAIRVPG